MWSAGHLSLIILRSTTSVAKVLPSDGYHFGKHPVPSTGDIRCSCDDNAILATSWDYTLVFGKESLHDNIPSLSIYPALIRFCYRHRSDGNFSGFGRGQLPSATIGERGNRA